MNSTENTSVPLSCCLKPANQATLYIRNHCIYAKTKSL